MHDGYAKARLIICYLLCFFFLCYFLKAAVIIIPKQTPTFSDNISKEEKTTEKQQEKTTKEEEKETKTETKNESSLSSVQANANAIKGKIITRYISPYTAPFSYDGVYLKNSTPLKINLKELVNKKTGFKIEQNSEPQVLIMHTHTTEAFMEKDSDYYTEEFKARSTDNSKNMVKIGDIIAQKLNQNGIKCLHDKTKHDYPEYTGSYGRSATTVKAYLKKYPSIKIVLDLHRDSVTSDGEKAKLVTQIGGKKAAQVMLVMGSQSGAVSDYPKWEENLSLAVKFHQKLEQEYPTLARPVLLRSSKYNQDLTTGSMLLEIGTEANSLEQACFSAQLVGDALVKLLKTLK